MSLDASTASPASSLLSIDGVTASQIIGSAAPQPLSSGRLDLLPAPAAASGGDDDSAEPLLVVQVAESVFPLYKDTVMGTHDGKEEWYTFSLPLKHDNALQAETSAQEQQTWVRLVLPPLTTPALVSLRDRFEEHLIARGLLYDGLRAAGDEVGRGAGQSGAEHARAIHQNAAAHQTTTDPTDTPWKFSRWSHSLSQGFKGSSGTVSEYTTAASNAVSGLAASAGAAAGSVYQKARDQLTTETADEKQERKRYEKQLDDGQAGGEDSRIMPNTRDAMYDAFQGAGQGLSDVTSATTKEAPSIVAHNVGEEASKIASDAGQGLQNVGKATADVTIGTSTVYHGVEAAKGAVQSSGK